MKKKRLRISQPLNSYWRVTIDHPPLNLFDQEMADELSELITTLEQNTEVKVVVFDSNDPDYFMAHLDILRAGELKLDPGPTGLSMWPDFALRIERASFITIGLLRGRARGVGNEFLLAMDMRFASKEKAILSQIEVGSGLIPGGGALERLPLLIGRARAMEVIIGSEDYDADTAEKYGWINRAIPDSQLNDFVDAYAKRIASFDMQAIVAAKKIINERSLMPQVEELAATQRRFFELVSSPTAKARLVTLFNSGLQTRGHLESRLGDMLGTQANMIPIERQTGIKN